MIPNLSSFTVPMLTFARDAFDVVHFLDAVSVAVGAKNVMEPNGRFVRVSLGPGFPGINCLGFSGDKAPIVRRDFLFFEVAQNWIERAVARARHVFRAE